MIRALLTERDRRFDEATAHQQSEWHEHLEQARREVTAALTAADKAVTEVDRRHSEQFLALERMVLARFDAEHTLLVNLAHERQTAIDAAFAAQQAAVNKAEVAAEKRFESINEFRAQLGDQAATFVPRQEAEAAIGRNTERVKELFDTVNTHVSRVEWAAANDRLTEQVRDLADHQNRNSGRGAGLNAGWVYILGALAALGTVMSLYLALKGG